MGFVSKDMQIAYNLNQLRDMCHGASRDAGWYTDLETDKPKERNIGELLMLIVSELSECFEGVRKDQLDDHLPAEKMEHVEMADVIIRIMDYCGYRGIDIGRLVIDKMAYNKNRPDHKIDARTKKNGKKF